MPTHEHDQETTSRPDSGEAELRREIDRLQRRVAELEAAASSQTDRALARKDALLQAILRNLPFDFWARDLHENIIMQSDASVCLWGDLSSTRVDDADVPEEIRSTWRAVNERVFAGETLEGEKEYLLSSGENASFATSSPPSAWARKSWASWAPTSTSRSMCAASICCMKARPTWPLCSIPSTSQRRCSNRMARSSRSTRPSPPGSAGLWKNAWAALSMISFPPKPRGPEYASSKT
jgi:hypothetical protein